MFVISLFGCPPALDARGCRPPFARHWVQLQARGRIEEKSSNLKRVKACKIIFVSLNCLRWISAFAQEQLLLPYLCTIMFYLLFYDQRYGPPLTLRWDT